MISKWGFMSKSYNNILYFIKVANGMSVLSYVVTQISISRLDFYSRNKLQTYLKLVQGKMLLGRIRVSKSSYVFIIFLFHLRKKMKKSRPGFEPATLRLEVQRGNHYTKATCDIVKFLNYLKCL